MKEMDLACGMNPAVIDYEKWKKEIIGLIESLIPTKYLNEDDNIIHDIILLDTYKKGANDVIRLFEKRIEELKKNV